MECPYTNLLLQAVNQRISKVRLKMRLFGRQRRKKKMSDSDFQAGLPAAMQAAFEAYVTSTGFAATLVAGASTISYVPAPTATPPTETVTF